MCQALGAIASSPSGAEPKRRLCPLFCRLVAVNEAKSRKNDNPCTKDTCFAASGCANVPLPDGSGCPGNKACSLGICG